MSAKISCSIERTYRFGKTFPATRATAKNYFRVAHWEATVKGSSIKALRALSRRSVNCSGVWAMKSVK